MGSKAFVANILLLLGVALLSSVAWCEPGNLRPDFYKYSCPSAESTVEMVVKKYIEKDITLAAPLLRLHFHDCFVRVCIYVSLNLYVPHSYLLLFVMY